ncbi:MAG TPA: hypothetical protein PLP21_06415 [Pyrinomonadaceae bacterium]|nr:hypothetical protein [Pyrinomonadaceae bacterium]
MIQRILSSADAEPQAAGTFNSSKTVSWKALREAETLTDIELIPTLKERIGSESDKKVRGAAYFILGKVAKNTEDDSVAQFLIDRTSVEKDQYIVGSIFDSLADIIKPVGTDLSLLIEATKNSKWLIRHSAISALKRSQDPRAEEVAIEISRQSTDSFDVVYANEVLNDIGTMRAIPILEKHLSSRKRDVKDSAKYAVEAIQKRNPAS